VRSRIYGDRAREIAGALNRKFIYDPDRTFLKVALLHGEGLNEHLHLQVHPKTRKREDGWKP